MRGVGCDHVGAPELIEMAEEHLRQQGIPPAGWSGRRFRHGQNLDEGMWASVVVEIERRGEDWVVTRLDRSRERVAETGFEALA